MTVNPVADAFEKQPSEVTSDSDQPGVATPAETPEQPVVEQGSIGEAKSIYRGPKDENDEYTWTSTIPEVEEAAENDETAKYALIVRKKKSEDSRKTFEAHSIIIQSPSLRKALGVILKDYTGVTTSLERLVFDAPFSPFVHRWAGFLAYLDGDLDATEKEHLSLLKAVLVEELGDVVKAFDDYVSNGVVTYEHLWTIFQPGQIVVSQYKGTTAAFELLDSEYMETRCGNILRLRCSLVDWDGENFGRGEESLDIPQFRGTKKIASLRAFPLDFHEDKEAVKANLIRRGRKFEELQGYHFKQYSGTAITWDRENNEIPIQVNGRIIVDISSFNRFSPFYARSTESMNATDNERFLEACEDGLLADLDAEAQSTATVSTKLTNYHHLICHPRTRGYSLKLRRWLDFYIDHITEITWNASAFDSLVLPADQKELILAFSEAQLANSATYDDVISGKGQGFILLLSGTPGVGKTLTAEAVAEHMRVPLHKMSAGDLGTTAGDVDYALSNALEMVARWHAIILLDECDVFLEARSNSDLERNRLVSIFLRELEYYAGIMFMTTNRVDNLDPAFQSRIHVSIEYPPLTTVARRQIWENFLEAWARENELREEDLVALAELELNGRQIKNVLKTAQLLASRRKTMLDRSIIDTVLAIEKRRPAVSATFGNAA